MPILVRFTCTLKVLSIKHTRKVPGFFAQKCIRSRFSRSLKGLEGPLLSVGFPQSSLDKFFACLGVAENGGGGGVKYCSSLARSVFVANLYKEVKDPNLIAKISGHVENSRAFSRYRDIDEEMAKEVILKLE